MDFFSLLNLEPAFMLDQSVLRRSFYANSKRFHPDFYTLESPEKQQEVMELASLNNEAYETLADADRRMQYLLELRGVLVSGAPQELPTAFLAEMMELNEACMELEFDFEPDGYHALLHEINALETSLFEAIHPILESYNHLHTTTEQLIPVKDFFLKKKYLLRIKEKLSIFANR